MLPQLGLRVHPNPPVNANRSGAARRTLQLQLDERGLECEVLRRRARELSLELGRVA